MSWELNPNQTYNDLAIHGRGSETSGYQDYPDLNINITSSISNGVFSLTATIHSGPHTDGTRYGFAFKVGVSVDKDDSYSNPDDHVLIEKASLPESWSTDDSEFIKPHGTFTYSKSGSHRIKIWFYGECPSCTSHFHWAEAAYIDINLSVTATFDPNDGKWWDGTTENKSVQVTPGTTPNPPGPATDYISRTGYRFNGWNPELGPISSDETYLAKWVAQSTLYVNPNGGTWRHGGHDYTTTQHYTQDAGSTLSVARPTGSSVTVTFKPNGGTWQSSPTTGNRTKSANRSFDGWKESDPFYGDISGTTYTFGSKANVKSTITATYGGADITTYSSSDIAQEGWLLKGWTDGTHLYSPGATISPSANLTLTAVWKTSPIMKYDGTKWVPWISPGSTLQNVDLVKVRNSSGSWEQKGKIYRYDGTSWVQILGKEK